MYSALHNIFADKPNGILFSCFGVWHIGYIALFFALGLWVLIYLKNKTYETRNKTTRLFITLSFGVLIADFFFMPIAYGEIDIEKLPFHVCTAMCVASFLSYYNSFFRKYRIPFAMLGFLSNLGYLIYPAGVMWHQTHPFSYRVIETLSFHGLMSIYGILILIYDAEKQDYKKPLRDLSVILCMIFWAMLGNYVYNGDYGEKIRFFNWFFVVRDPFYILPQSISPFVMPLINLMLFFVPEMIIYSLLSLAKGKTE